MSPIAQNTPILGLPWADLTDSANANTLSRNLAEGMDTKGVPRFASTAARDAAITAPTEGQLCYITSSAAGFHVLQVYRGSWRNMGEQPVFKRQAANLTKNNNVSLTNTDLTFSVETNTTYAFDGVLLYSTQNDAGTDFAFTFPAGTNMTAAFWVPGVDGDNALGVGLTTWVNHATDDGTSPTGRFYGPGLSQATEHTIAALCRGYAITGATAGSITLQFAQATAFADNSIFWVGSFMEMRRVG